MTTMDSKICSDPCESNLSNKAKEGKPRRKRSKFSSVSSRLDPNFDLREFLKQRDEGTKTKNVELNPRTMEFEKLVGLLHPSFILEYLQKILHYLTSSMTKMSFQNIALYKEVLLVRLCQEKSNLKCAKFSEESKKVARQIVEVLKANENVYEWTYKYDRGIFNPDVLVFEKVYRNLQISISNGSNVIGDHNLSRDSNASDGSLNSDPNKSLKQKAKLSFIEVLDEKFVRASLRDVLHFMEDEARASLCFTQVTKEEKRYLNQILQCLPKTHYYKQFPPECQVLLRKIKEIHKNANWRLIIESGKKNKETTLQNVTMRKEPHISKLTVHSAPQSQTTRKATPVCSPRGTHTPAKAKAITFQSAGAIATTIIKNATETERTIDAAKLVANSTRKSKLLADMSVPVESYKGERMMRLMGWRGGALGLRGEGITEPIIPAIHLARGVGLGHVKHVKTTQTISEFRCQFLNSFLSFLRAEESETTLEYTDSLEKKKVRFVNRAIQSLKRNTGCGLTLLHEKQLLEEVLAEMGKQEKQVEGCVSGPDNKKIFLKKAPLRKNKQNKQTNNPNSTPQNPVSARLDNQITPIVQNIDASDGFVTERITENNVDALREHFDLDSKVETLRAAKYLANKVMFLRKLHCFLQTDGEKRCYLFECILNNKLKSFISTVIMNVNKKTSPHYGSDVENSIYSDIRKASPQGCCLKVEIEDQKVTLHKKVYQKRFTNSERDPPPPKSTDLKNTIIYQNNKIIFNGVTNDVDDDDVIIIENEIDVIVISDDEDYEMNVDCVKENTDHEIDNSNKPNTDLGIENSNKPVVEEIAPKNEVSLDDSLISIDFLQDLSTSRETLLLESLEEDFKVKTEIVDSELDCEIRELEQAIINCDIICDDEVLEPEQILLVKQELYISENDCKDLDSDINNYSLITENKPNLLVSDYMQQKEQNFVEAVDCGINEKHSTDKSLDNLPAIKNENITEIKNEDKGKSLSSLQLSKEDDIEKPENVNNTGTFNKSLDNSQLSTESFAKQEKSTEEILNSLQTNKEYCDENREITIKRSRSASMTSERESSCKKYKSQIRSVQITCKDPNEILNTDVIWKVQSVISKSIDTIIDNVDFLPRLECHGVKKGGLMYSCHDDKTFAWLTNFVITDLDLNISETDYPSETYKMEIKMYSSEDIDKILRRLKLYNPELDTRLWRVIDKKEFKNFVIITVEIDKDSYNYVNKNNYSLFAGVDKAKFSVVWS